MVFVFSVVVGDAKKNISANLMRALEYAQEVGATICGIVGRDGGYTAQVANACVLIPVINSFTITPHTESFQAMIWHLLGPKPADAPLQVPGRSVQLDVKFVPRVGRARQRFYQFTAIDEATRFRVLRIYDHNNTKTAIDFLREVREHFPFAIHKIQADNDSSFGPQFTWHLSDLSISHRHIPLGCPEVNGKVERSHKTDSEEFYQGRRFRHKRDLARKLKKWEAEYNEDRPHLALKGKTPAERVRELVQSSNPVRDLR